MHVQTCPNGACVAAARVKPFPPPAPEPKSALDDKVLQNVFKTLMKQKTKMKWEDKLNEMNELKVEETIIWNDPKIFWEDVVIEKINNHC